MRLKLTLLLIRTGWQGDDIAEAKMNLGGKGYDLIPKAGKTNSETKFLIAFDTDMFFI